MSSVNPELRDLIAKIEGNRRRKEFINMGGGVLAGLAVLAIIGLTVPSLMPAKKVAEAPSLPTPSPYDGIATEAKAAIVYDLVTGKVLYEKNAHAQLPLASLTKLLTVYAGANALGAGAPITVSANAISTEGESGFTAGEEFSFTEIAKATLVGSVNDAAAAIAETAEARRSLSAEDLLTSAAAAVGLSATYAVNGTGLDETGELSGGYGSAQDVAILAGALLQRARGIAEATTHPTVTVDSLSGRTYTFKNTNPNVGRIPGLELSKTGFTDLAGGNLAIIFDASINHPIAVVVLGSSVDGRFIDVEHLVKATLSSFVHIP